VGWGAAGMCGSGAGDDWMNRDQHADCADFPTVNFIAYINFKMATRPLRIDE
jgi:hypothetical protein